MPGTSDKIWTEDITVRSYDIDQYGRLSPLPLCDFLLDAAGNHAKKLGLSLHDLQSRQYTWVLSRMILKMDVYPVWRDTITIQTWPSGIEKLFALRDFEITDEQNRVIGAGVSAWLVIDVESRRPVRIKPFFETLDIIYSGRSMIASLDKLPELDQHTIEHDFTVRYRDLDVNRHVNSVSYIEWALESIPVDIRNTSILSEFEINYLAETHYGDTVISRSMPQNDRSATSSFLHCINHADDGRELIRARSIWKHVI